MHEICFISFLINKPTVSIRLLTKMQTALDLFAWPALGDSGSVSEAQHHSTSPGSFRTELRSHPCWGRGGVLQQRSVGPGLLVRDAQCTGALDLCSLSPHQTRHSKSGCTHHSPPLPLPLDHPPHFLLLEHLLNTLYVPYSVATSQTSQCLMPQVL